MKMNAPAGSNPIDANRHGWIGKPVDRVDGRLKVTGAATYADEYREGGQAAYGFLVQATIGKGRIEAIDSAAAASAAGVLLVMTHLNAPPQAAPQDDKTAPQLFDAEIRHYGQPVALIVAETYEAARAAAGLVRLAYAEQPGRYTLAAVRELAVTPPPGLNAPDSRVGDFETAFAGAAIRVDSEYTTPYQIHIQMEPHATLATWQDGKLTLYTSNQWLEPARQSVAATLGLAPDNVRVISRYVGGGFGSKLDVYADAILAALAARQLQRPVRIALTRQQVFHVCAHRSETIQRVRLGADLSGRLNAIAHEVWCENLAGLSFY
jgi:xanthine dehydrogenase YagR molybdenum-binding subunit